MNNKDAAVIATTGVSAFLLLAGMVFAEDLRREPLVVRPDPAVRVWLKRVVAQPGHVKMDFDPASAVAAK